MAHTSGASDEHSHSFKFDDFYDEDGAYISWLYVYSCGARTVVSEVKQNA